MKEAEKIFNQIQAVITETLPSQVGETLQKRLQMADKLEIDLEEANKEILQLKKTIEARDETIRDRDNIISKHDSLTSREQEVKAREDEVFKKELTMENNKLKYELDTEKTKTEFVRDVTMGLVRNTNYRKTIFDGESTHVPGFVNQSGDWIPDTMKNVTKNYNETETEE